MIVLAVALIVPPVPATNRLSSGLSLPPPLRGPARRATLLTKLTVPVATELPPVTSTPPEPSRTELTTFAVPPARMMAGPLFESRIVLDETLIVASLPATMPAGMAVRP